MKKKVKKANVQSSRLKRRAVAVALNGKIGLALISKKLRVPLKRLRKWKRQFQNQIPKKELHPKVARVHLKLIQALFEKAKAHAKVIKLRAALQRA